LLYPEAAAQAGMALRGREDGLTALAPVCARFPRFADLLDDEPETDMFDRLRAAESIGRPLGDDRFLARIERLTHRGLRAGKRGPKPKTSSDQTRDDH
jgi:putative transposase